MDYFTTATDASFSKRASEENAGAFFNQLNSPNSIGCVDGRHIRMKSPKDIGSNILHLQAVFSLYCLLHVMRNINCLC
jgi:hypothetical protein